MESQETISLERRKLALEIADLERPWWKRPTYILAALPTLLAVVALSVGFLNGFFSAQLTKLENQRHDLEAQVKAFQLQKEDLSRENLVLYRQMQEAQSKLEEQKQFSLARANQQVDAEIRASDLQAENEKLKKELETLKKRK